MNRLCIHKGSQFGVVLFFKNQGGCVTAICDRYRAIDEFRKLCSDVEGPLKDYFKNFSETNTDNVGLDEFYAGILVNENDFSTL